MDETFQRSPEVRDLFLAICRNWGRTTLTLREMHELGVLGRYLPEWGALTCLVQYDVYHRFTADQHSLLAVENLEALAPGQSAEAEGIAEVLNEVARPDLLMLGMLLHDIGKGKGHGHVAKGIPLIHELTARHRPADGRCRRGHPAGGASPHAVAHRPAARHRRSQDGGLSRRGGGQSRAAAHALSPHLRRHARGGAGRDDGLDGAHPLGAVHAHDGLAHRRASLERPSRETVAERVAEAAGGARGGVVAHLAMMSDRYLITTSAQRIAAHLRLVERLEEDVVATDLFHHPDLDSSELVIATKDVPGLFSLIAGTLAAEGINILSAQIHTRADGIALDTFQVNDPFGEAVTEDARWRRTLCRAAPRAAGRADGGGGCWPRAAAAGRSARRCRGRPRSRWTTSSPIPIPWWR